MPVIRCTTCFSELSQRAQKTTANCW